ncbi:MAG: hypothetical protein WCJ18_06335 [Planctomycetota bacterium]
MFKPPAEVIGARIVAVSPAFVTAMSPVMSRDDPDAAMVNPPELKVTPAADPLPASVTVPEVLPWKIAILPSVQVFATTGLLVGDQVALLLDHVPEPPRAVLLADQYNKGFSVTTVANPGDPTFFRAFADSKPPFTLMAEIVPPEEVARSPLAEYAQPKVLPVVAALNETDVMSA